MEQRETLKTILEQKQQILHDIYVITNSLNLKNDHEPLQSYISMVEGRELLFDRLKEKDLILSTYDLTKIDSETKVLLDKIAETMQNIIEKDKMLKGQLPEYMTELKQNIKNLNESRSAFNHYQNDFYFERGGRFDMSN